MDGAADGRALSAGEVEEALARLRSDRAPYGGLLLAVRGTARVVWANAAIAALFGETEADGLSRRAFFETGLGPAVDRLPGGDGRDERIRVADGLRSRTVTATLDGIDLSSGRRLVALAIPEGAPDGAAGDWGSSVLGDAAPPVSALAMTGEADHATAGDSLAAEPARTGPVPTPVTGRGAGRWIWRTDALDRVTLVEGGPDPFDLVGRSLPDAIAERGGDPDGSLARAFAGRATWSGLRSTWPAAGNGPATEVVLGAVPTFGPMRDFQGYRGFGTVVPTPLGAPAPVAAPPDPPRIATDGAPEPANDHGPAVLAPSPVRDDGSAGPAPQGAVEPGARVPAVMTSDQYSSKVVMLRAYKAVTPLSGAAVLSDSARLSPAERSAFEEIGLALGGRGDGPAPRSGAAAWDAAAIDALPIAVWSESAEGPSQANRAFLDLTGYASAADLAARGGVDHLIGGSDLPLAEAGDDRAFAVLDADGRTVAVEGRGLVVDADVDHRTVVLAFRPAPRVQPDATADLASEALASLDPDGALRRINRGGEHLFGRSSADLVGHDLVGFLAPEGREEVAALMAGLASRGDGETATARARLRRPDGTAIPVLVTACRTGSAGVSVALRDDGAIERLQQANAAALDQVERLKQGRADFLAKVSHDVRTPLNGILGFAEVILDERFGPIGNPRYRDYLLDIHQSGTHVLALISDLLDLSKMEAGRFDVSVAAVDVNRIVTESVAQLQPDAHRERIIMRTSLLPRLPSALVDERALRQMMDNVLSNAVKFNEPGGQVIVSTALNDAGAIAIRVRDTGVGMSEAEIAAATDPFRQVATTNAQGGSGLGLPLTKALADANGATVSIKSRKQEGTLIEILLPADPEQPVRAPAA